MGFGRFVVVWPTAVALIAMVAFCVVKKRTVSQTVVRLLFVVSIAAIVAITLLPITYYLKPGQTPDVGGYNLVPLVPLANMFEVYAEHVQWMPWVQIGGNIAMFIPFGFLLPLLSERARRFKRSALIVLAAAVGVELAQLLIGLCLGYLYRCVDVNDVILNFIGGLLGYLAFLGVSRLATRVRSALRGASTTR